MLVLNVMEGSWFLPLRTLVFQVRQICGTNVKIICVKLIGGVQEIINKRVKKEPHLE